MDGLDLVQGLGRGRRGKDDEGDGEGGMIHHPHPSIPFNPPLPM